VLSPWAAQQLGDLGADVIEDEPPEGDTTRQLGPMKNRNRGAFYLAVNRCSIGVNKMKFSRLIGTTSASRPRASVLSKYIAA
jgi:hypothetical protein